MLFRSARIEDCSFVEGSYGVRVQVADGATVVGVQATGQRVAGIAVADSAKTVVANSIVRDSGGHITGFAGPATFYATAPYIDGGLWWMPNGTLCYATYKSGQNAAPGNCIGQILPGASSPAVVTAMSTKGITIGSLGTGTIIPAGFAGAEIGRAHV